MRDRLPKPLRDVWDLVSDTIAAGGKHELDLYAPAIAYSLVISLAPLTLVINLLGPRVLESVEVLPGSPLAGADLSPERLYGAVIGIAGPLAPVIVLALVIWGAGNLFRQVGRAMTAIWQQGPAPGGLRAFVRHHLVSLALLMVAAAALFASSVIGNALANLGAVIVDAEARVGVDLDWVGTALSSKVVVDFLFSVLLFLMASTVVPRMRPRLRDVLPGAVLTAAAFAIGQSFLAGYLAGSSRFGALGSFGALLAFLIWALYTSTIVLWGMELTHEIAKRRACARGGEDAAPYACSMAGETVS